MTAMRRIGTLVLPVGVLLVATGALLRWWSLRWSRPLLGDQSDTVTGTAAAPSLIVLALAALAGWAAAAGTRSTTVRRGIAVLVVLIGVAVCTVVLGATAAGPREVVLERHPEAADVGAASLTVTGPVLAILGGVLLAVAGVRLLVRRGGRGMGTRFDRGPTTDRSGAPAAPRQGTDEPRSGDEPDPEDDAALLWKGLDAGDDPTR